MNTVNLTLRNGDRIRITGLPVTLDIPEIPDGEAVTVIEVLKNGIAQPLGQPVSVLPTDRLSIALTSTTGPVVEVRGTDIYSAYLDGKSELVSEDGVVKFSWTGITGEHSVIMQGRQMQQSPITLTVDNSGSSSIAVNGKTLESGDTINLTGDAFVQSKGSPIPVHFELNGTGKVQVNGAVQTSDDFTIEVDSPTEIDIDNSVCELTVDYGDSSYTLTVPQDVITICAPHRDWWLFDCWSSPDVGIENPKLVRTVVDLTGTAAATLVAHYQKFPAWTKPNLWN